MPTLMTEPTFARLSAARSAILEKDAASKNGPAGVFVPWAGSSLQRTGSGAYFVGMALAPEESTHEQSFPNALHETESVVAKATNQRSPFWIFVNLICQELFGSPATECSTRWGWSNLFKVADSLEAKPDKWKPIMRNIQLQECRVALKEEFGRLAGSVVIVMSATEYGFLYEDVAEKRLWDIADRRSRTHFLWDQNKRNLFVHSDHPRYMRGKGHMAEVIKDVVMQTKASLPELAQAAR